jgi:microcystin degradation protein MlrC
MAGKIVAAVAQGCDAVLLDLHGAMVTQSHEDGEGELLRRIRAVAPTVPIGLALDMHTNLYDAIGQHATVIAGYQTYPHIDVYETGLRAGKAILAMLAGQAKPAMAFGRQPGPNVLYRFAKVNWALPFTSASPMSFSDGIHSKSASRPFTVVL